MLEQITTYKLSKGIRQAKKRYVVISMMMFIILTTHSFLSPVTRHESFSENARIVLFVSIPLGLIIYFTASIGLRKMSELTVTIDGEKIERKGKKHSETFFWKDFLNGKVDEYPNGEISSIRLTFANNNRIILFGFEDMETAIQQITSYIPDQSHMPRKRAKINWDHPVSMIGMGVFAFAFMLILQEMGDKAIHFSVMVSNLGLGLYILFARPMVRVQGKGWKNIEKFFSIFLIIGSVLLLVLLLTDN